MVFLSRIYTRGGDRGETDLGDGTRVAKDHPRVAAYGGVDELNAVLGLLLVSDASLAPELQTHFRAIQNDLFDLNADLCVPQKEGEKPGAVLRIRAEQVTQLERSIDHFNERLQPLRSFVLPGGSTLAAWCHLARVVCRRAERDVVTLMRTETINAQVLMYLNRLSDWLFVVGRVLNRDGADDVLWVPGGVK